MPWVPVNGDTYTYLDAKDETVKLEFVELPTMEQAQKINDAAKQTLAERQKGAQDWEIRLAIKHVQWAEKLVEAVRAGNPTVDLVVQVIRVNDIAIAALSAEAFFQTGLEIRAKSPFKNTIVLGFSNGSVFYLPRAEDYPKGGWKINESYAVPDMLFQFNRLPVAFHPKSEHVVVERTLRLLQEAN
jgi:hypothetical protein